MNIQRLINKSIRDKNNSVVIWQRPNLPIIGWAVFAVAARVFRTGNLHAGLTGLSTAFLFAWAYLELTQGASYFRRLLGLAVIAGVVVHYFS